MEFSLCIVFYQSSGGGGVWQKKTAAERSDATMVMIRIHIFYTITEAIFLSLFLPCTHLIALGVRERGYNPITINLIFKF
jgi:hypothetical protein